MARKKKGKWIQKADKRMEEKGTKGSFGPATEKNIEHGLAEGGLEAKRANFARNMKRIAAKRHHRKSSRR